MADVHNPAQRSYNMSRIRSTGTKPEMLVRQYLHAKGFRYKLHDKNLPGKPDLVLPKYCTVIFIHGCFWHGHSNCKYYKVPQTRTNWWLQKIGTNQTNDAKAILALQQQGWKIIIVWECDLKPAKAAGTLQALTDNITT